MQSWFPHRLAREDAFLAPDTAAVYCSQSAGLVTMCAALAFGGSSGQSSILLPESRTGVLVLLILQYTLRSKRTAALRWHYAIIIAASDFLVYCSSNTCMCRMKLDPLCVMFSAIHIAAAACCVCVCSTNKLHIAAGPRVPDLVLRNVYCSSSTYCSKVLCMFYLIERYVWSALTTVTVVIILLLSNAMPCMLD